MEKYKKIKIKSDFALSENTVKKIMQRDVFIFFFTFFTE